MYDFMRLPIYQVDAFASKVFRGNPAAVCPLDVWLPDATMQAIAAENNLSETAFFVKNADGSYHLRWFTPESEIPLCGHATLASAYVLFEELGFTGEVLRFQSMTGELRVTKQFRNGKTLFFLDFPTRPVHAPDDVQYLTMKTLSAAFGKQPLELWQSGPNYLVVLETARDVIDLEPDFFTLRTVDIRGIIVSATVANSLTQAQAAAQECDVVDFVSRFFAPADGINEDPVTGSAHSTLVPFWAERLGKTKLIAHQASKRGGDLYCELKEVDGEQRVMMGGHVVPYLQGFIEI
jgi:PhzF family phenazine biosynthesis protein